MQNKFLSIGGDALKNSSASEQRCSFHLIGDRTAMVAGGGALECT